ncbi:hypothetical protein MKW94_003141, partial [Papaver nudicaule]|nr:hypothetical protein [Papaver nudicaule]
CDGECKRCFHATVADAGADSNCDSLGLSKAELAASKFFCLNCQYKEHQCFSCGVLGSSDSSSVQEVYRCASPSCGHFYHPACVANLLYPENEVQSKNLQNKIATGEPFTCSAHKCYACEKTEDSMVDELQFAICRRCPRAYHYKCLPREIADAEELGHPQRAWEDLLPRNRTLIYCLKHKIQKHLATPAKNHIVFPEVKTKAQSLSSSQQRILKRKRIISEEFQRSVSSKKTKQAETQASTKESNSVENNVKRFSVQSLDSSKRLSTSCTSETTLKQQTVPTSSIGSVPGSEPLIDAEAKKRVKMLVDEAEFSITLKDFKRGYKNRDKLAKSKKLVNTANSQDKTEGSKQDKAEGTNQAVRTVLDKLDEHSKFDESNNVFDPKILNLITKQKVVDKLHAYIHNGDTVVNVSFTVNDFTCSMKQRLEGSGKDCSFRNYNVCQSKNVCTVEEPDWLSVPGLATGSKLIICLNIPVGISSALADNSIDKALSFKPKLLVLFVPENVNRLEKKHLYELIWKDSEELSTKLLPSSMRISDNNMKLWNSKPPVLYLWSRMDWCPQHKKIASLCGHMPISQNDTNEEGGKDEEEEDVEEEDELEEVGEDEDVQGEEERDDQEHEQETHDEKVAIDSDSTHEDHEDSPDKLRSMTSPSHGMRPSSSAHGDNQEAEDKKEEEDKVQDEEEKEDQEQEAYVLDFAPGPYVPYSHDKHSCCGWIDDD